MAVEESPLAPPAELALPALAATPAEGARKWLAIGTGAGIEIAGEDLRIVVARVRPGGVEVVAHCVIAAFSGRPAAEWGAEYAAFARRAQASSLPVTVVLPRRDVVVRHLHMPGVETKELGSAVSWQVDSLHPYADEPVAHAWGRLGDGAAQVMVGLVRQDLLDRYTNLFSEAGLKLASITFSAAALYSASRILVKPPAAFLAVHADGPLTEAYGESAARPVFSTWFDEVPEGVEPRALAEMRAGEELVTVQFADLLPPLRRQPDASFDRRAIRPVNGATLFCPIQRVKHRPSKKPASSQRRK